MKTTIVGNHVTLEFDIDPNGKLSSTGKSTIAYTTGGFDWNSLPGYGVSLNVIKSKK